MKLPPGRGLHTTAQPGEGPAPPAAGSGWARVVGGVGLEWEQAEAALAGRDRATPRWQPPPTQPRRLVVKATANAHGRGPARAPPPRAAVPQLQRADMEGWAGLDSDAVLARVAAAEPLGAVLLDQ